MATLETRLGHHIETERVEVLFSVPLNNLARCSNSDGYWAVLDSRGGQRLKSPVHDQDYVNLAFQGEFDSPQNGHGDETLEQALSIRRSPPQARTSLGPVPASPSLNRLKGADNILIRVALNKG